MTDDLPDLTPAETERVRRLLAEARHTDPVPDDVAARLDRTLATLAGHQRELEARTVSSLAARRRRPATRLLVAAVAVVVVGVGVGRLVSGLDSGLDSGTVGASSDDSSAGGSSADREAAPQQSAGTGAGKDQQPQAQPVPPRVADGTFEADAAAARTPLAAADSAVDSLHGLDCDRKGWGPGQRVVVVYHDDFAALVFRPATRGTQVVDLFACDGDVVLRSGSVPAP